MNFTLFTGIDRERFGLFFFCSMQLNGVCIWRLDVYKRRFTRTIVGSISSHVQKYHAIKSRIAEIHYQFLRRGRPEK